MKYIYLFIITIIGSLMVGCNPMDSINSEIDTIADDGYVSDTFVYNRELAPEAYILLDEDYELSSNEDVATYKNFSEYALPKDYLPEILNKKFVASNAFGMNVSYNYYSKPVVNEDAAYTISDEEYAEMGQRYPGFDSEDAAEDLIGKLLDRKLYAAEAGVEQTVLYNEYLKSQIRFILVNKDTTTIVLDEEPTDVYALDSADYEAIGASYYNFTFVEDAEVGVVSVGELRGHVFPKTYSAEVYRNFFPTYKVFYFDGSNWVAKQSVMEVSEPLNYDLDEDDITKSTWWADPAIKITLGSDDYLLFPETSKYSNFDLRSGSVPGTDDDLLVEMLGAMLDANHGAVEGQQYLVSYAYYDNSNGIGTNRLIKTAGVWSEYVAE